MRSKYLNQRFKQGLLLGSLLLFNSGTSYGFGALQTQQQLQQLQTKTAQLETQVKQLQPYQAKATQLETQVRQLQQSNQQTQTGLTQCQAEKRQAVQTHEAAQARYTQQIQEGLARERQLQEDLANAQQQTGNGGNPQEILNLQQQITTLQQEIARYNPTVVAQIIDLPTYNNPNSYIHQTQAVVADPQLTLSVNNAKGRAIIHIDNLIGNINALIAGNRAMVAKRLVTNALTDLKDAINVPDTNIDWGTFSRVKGQIDGNQNNFDRIPANNGDITGLKQELTALENLRGRVEQENAQNDFYQLQQNIANITQHTAPLDVLADNFLNVHVPALTNAIPHLGASAKNTVKEIIEKIQVGEFDNLKKQLDSNVPIFGPTYTWLRSEFMRAGMLNVIENYKNAVDHYMQQITALSPHGATRLSAKDLHLIRHGTTRFNTAFQALNGQNIVNVNNNTVLQRILTTNNPLNLQGDARRQFATDIKQLHGQRDNDLAPVTNLVRELVGGYLELERAAALLYTEDNPRPQ